MDDREDNTLIILVMFALIMCLMHTCEVSEDNTEQLYKLCEQIENADCSGIDYDTTQ